MSQQELFFEVRRNRSHIYLDAEESHSVMELKLMLAGITRDPVNHMELWKLDEDGNKSQLLHDTATLSDAGFSSTNAKAQCPAALGLRLTNAEEHLTISDVSTAPPIPDTMRQEQAPQE
ncbi:Ubiquitin-like domain-containing protein [Caenorhabditis elegans]|uniref:RNA polymerase II transcription factor SIII p18 subunit n=1 Tax=Caenorhabditis elegans TaxID=6239 RepID=G5ECR7_CAEEL|nr:Ubiquitin-like domain-containing protein [Caenorhabditis elegans]AAG49392.1 RNA polymerase II transcription factor SIII p18 subunit [Caenorhabditis elegans]CAA21548.1 Ubiquitin-like domain-containing protein [Caenorhabditis elegans]|eukprot:NP_499517.1 ELongin B [Caenorhabditis elegans]